jgi:hypothetical protein
MRRLLLSFLPCLLAAQAVPEPARIQAFQTTAKAVRRGGAVTLRWSATGADQVRLDPLGLILPAKGELTHLVTGRTVYWLHVTNAAGGQSAPVVVDLLPEEPALALPPPPAPPELPRLAALPPAHRHARRRGPRRAWIQFAATVSPQGAERLRRNLQRVAAMDATLLARARRAGRPYQLVRTGPFPSVQVARLRLEALAPAMQALNLKPIIVVGPAPATTYLASAGPQATLP